MEAQRLTIGDLVVFKRQATKGDVNSQITLANMRQNRHHRAIQIRSSFQLLQGGKANEQSA